MDEQIQTCTKCAVEKSLDVIILEKKQISNSM